MKAEYQHHVTFILAILAIVYINESMFSIVHFSAITRLSLNAVLCALILIIGQLKIRIKKKTLIVALIFILVQLVSIILNGFAVEFDIYAMGIILFAMVFTSVIPECDYIDHFQKIIVAISLISSILFLVNLINSSLISVIPSAFLTKGSYEGVSILFGTFVVKLNVLYSYNRNFGIFMEPGMFQIFINTALYFELFVMRKISKKRIMVLLLAEITCMSSTGIIVGIIILAASLFNMLNLKKKKSAFKLIRISVIVLITFCIYMYVDGSAVYSIVSEISGKIIDMDSNSFEGTGAERTRAITTALQCWLENPVFGLGYAGVNEYIYNINSDGFIMTFSPLNWFARFGIIYGLLSNVFFLSFFTRNTNNLLSAILVCMAFFIMISTQAVNANMFVWMIIFYSISNWKQQQSREITNRKGNVKNI